MVQPRPSRRYEAIPTNINKHPSQDDLGQSISIHEVSSQDKSSTVTPQRLDSSWGSKLGRACLDVVIAAIALLFAVFGFLVNKNDGTPPHAGSQAAAVVSAAKYGPTVFPIIFAAIVGGAMKTIATWKMQQGATLGLVEQLLGSNSISGVLFTQARMLAFNITAILLIILWCLSPLGSQASLRVVSVVPSYLKSNTTLTALNTFSEYEYGNADGLAEGMTIIIPPFIASLMSGSLLQSRNQDLWGNLRLPSIERLADGENTDWVNITDPINVEYSSLVGVPVTTRPSAGNTTFEFSGSYLNLTCGVLEQRSSFTNFSSPAIPSPGGKTDCTWFSVTASGNTFQIAMSLPCGIVQISNSSSRDARKLIWESNDETDGNDYTHAECELYTTYVDVNMLCTSNTCSPSSVRRSLQPPQDRNWTVFDFGGGHLDGIGFLQLFSKTFPSAEAAGTNNPQVVYLLDPVNTIGGPDSLAAYTVGKTTFEQRLAQMLNAMLVLGIRPTQVVGSFNASLAASLEETTMQILATTSVEQDIIHCNRAWLGVLIVSSFTLFLIAFAAGILRLITLVPDMLGTMSLAMLDNKTQTLTGNSTWSWNERAVRLRRAKLRLGDINAEGEFGQIAVAPIESTSVNVVKKDTGYE
ncbi:hypothetical protein B7463_g9553, partial [Scytalidium lignicola]